MNTRLAIVILSLLVVSCSKQQTVTTIDVVDELRWEQLAEHLRASKLPERDPIEKKRFTSLTVAQSGLDFAHNWEAPAGYDLELYRSVPGGGVCIGDVDGDDLPEIFLTQPEVGSKLYRNLGGLRFEEVTNKAGISNHQHALGVVFIDIDGDSDLDLHICNRDEPNCLYINRGDGVFNDEAEARGLAFSGSSIMAAFADYDRDGDLDAFLVTYRTEPTEPVPTPERNADGTYEIPEEQREFVDVLIDQNGKPRVLKAAQRDRLFQNNGNGNFTDVSRAAGIEGNYWGLSATWWDYDRDGHLDLYISNDFYSPDQLYRSNGDGTFTDVARNALPHTPWYSMGTDVADINNDGLLDFMGSDMAGSNHYKQKASMGDMAENAWFLTFAEPRQYMRNALYLNTGTERFMEIAQMAGVANTDWTWSLKFADLDEDGWIDLYVTNGMNRDWTNSDTRSRADAAKNSDARMQVWLESPQRNDPNLAFRNAGGLHFENESESWGLGAEQVSYGAAFADLDRDGDLDLVVNNAESAPGLYQNHSHGTPRILLRLDGNGLGATVKVASAGNTQTRILTSGQGYMAANEPLLQFGLGSADSVDELEIRWPSGQIQSFENLPTDRYYIVSEAGENISLLTLTETIYRESNFLPGVHHRETPFNDYLRQPLLPHQHSQLGPCLAAADVDGDGKIDIFLGGASGQAGQLLLNRTKFTLLAEAPWEADAKYEDLGATFFDADGDGDQDLYVVSGGVECEPSDELLRDRLYLNDGGGKFTRGELPDIRDSGSKVAEEDFDKDGDLDLFVGARIVPGQFPISPISRLLRNDGGVFTQVGAGLELGMVTDALWSDVDGDGWTDLLVTTELGPVRLLRNIEGKLAEHERAHPMNGWFYSIAGGDFDHDGDIDYVVGNLGRNTKYHPTEEKPYIIYFGDFENTGRKHLVEAEFEGDTLFPMRGKSCSTNAMPHLGKKFTTFHNFASASLDEIYEEQKLQTSKRYVADHSESGVLINDGRGGLTFHPLPKIAQASPVFGILPVYADSDGHLDLILAGNFYGPQPETGRFDGGVGLLLRGNGDGSFDPVPTAESGILIPGDAKAAISADLDGDGDPELIIGNNNAPVQIFQRQPRS